MSTVYKNYRRGTFFLSQCQHVSQSREECILVSHVALFNACMTGATRDPRHVQTPIVVSPVHMYVNRETVSILLSRNGISLSRKCCLIHCTLLWAPPAITGMMQMKAIPPLVLMWPKWRQTPSAKHVWATKQVVRLIWWVWIIREAPVLVIEVCGLLVSAVLKNRGILSQKMYAKKLMISPCICRMDAKSEPVAEVCFPSGFSRYRDFSREKRKNNLNTASSN